MAELVVVGLSHRTAPLEVREKIAFPDDALVPALRALGALPTIGEAMLLSTCNRVEIYAATKGSGPATVAEVRQFLIGTHRIDEATLAPCLYDRVGGEAVRHVFRVASSLDSLVIGEPQILGQLKSAFGLAHEAGSVGPLLGRCLERAFGVAKRVRSETAIARGAANVSSVAVQLAERVFGELEGKTVLVIGAGKMADLAARHLADDGAGRILVTNRSPARAESLAARVGGVARPWNELEALLVEADVVVSSTGATEPILRKAQLKAIMKARKHRSIFIIDIAVPRDVEPESSKLDGVYLFDIDDLERVVMENRKGRERESTSAEHIVETETLQFLAWQRTQGIVPTIRALRERFQAVARAEVDKAGIGDEKVARAVADGIVAKLLHAPLMALKGEDAAELAAAAERLFGLEAGDNPPARAPTSSKGEEKP